ncbi:MAG: hypothetical protein R3C68_14755 [Myxococcota bacterium]
MRRSNLTAVSSITAQISFAVGVMMFELLCSAPLFQADTADKLMRLNKKAKIPRPSKINPNISPELEGVLLRALQRKPHDCYATANVMLAALTPLIPKPVGMSLAVAAFLRQVFVAEHIKELQLREGLAGNA